MAGKRAFSLPFEPPVAFAWPAAAPTRPPISQGFAEEYIFLPHRLFHREWQLATTKDSPRYAAEAKAGFPAPAPFWVGLRPFILMAPLTKVLSPAYLLMHTEGATFYSACCMVAYLAWSGRRMAQVLVRIGGRVGSGHACAPLAPRPLLFGRTPVEGRAPVVWAPEIPTPYPFPQCPYPVQPYPTFHFSVLRPDPPLHEIQEDAELARARDGTAYTKRPNPLQMMMLCFFLPLWRVQ